MELRFKFKEIPQFGTPFRARGAVSAALLAEVLDGSGGDASQAEVELEIELSRDHDQILAHGKLRGALELPCSRCVESAVIRVDAPVDLIFTRDGDEPEAPADVEVLMDAPDAFTHDGVSVDLEPATREILIAELPITTLCKRDCRGLCGTCGANLNNESCGHAAVEIDLSQKGMKGLSAVKLSH